MGSRRMRAGGAAALVTAAAVAGATLLTGSAGAAPQTPGDALTAGLQQLTATDGAIGAIGVVRTGSDTQYAGAGYGDYFNKVAADPHATFRIGSNTKAFTSTVILQLEAEHKLSIDDTVEHWLPGVVDANGYDGSRITIRELLDHTSGIPDYAEGSSQTGYVANLNPSQQYTPQQLVNLALQQSAPTSAPGAAYRYSNTEYILAGMIIQAVTGDSPVTEIQNRIITPLGLTGTTFPTTDPTMPAGSLDGYYHIHGTFFVVRDVTTSSSPSYFWTAGGMISTLADQQTFQRALVSGQLLPAAQLRELETTVPTGDPSTGSGLGVGVYQTPCGTAITHTGATLGYVSAWATSPDGQRQAMIAVNEYDVDASQGAAIPADEITAVVSAFCATG